jgi:hypothetical protein
MDFAKQVVKALEVPHTDEEGVSSGLQFVSVSLKFRLGLKVQAYCIVPER